jgi:cobalt-zinc-cadmium efflux system protein
MTHGHHHHHDLSPGARTRRRLALVLGITFAVMVVEAVGGLLTGSLALLADAGHMLSDLGALGFALFAAWFSSRPSPLRHTYGYQRVEILAAQINVTLLALVIFFVGREAVERLRTPQEISVLPMAFLGGVGLLGNIISVRILREDAHTNLNVRGAYLEVLADLLASVGVLVAAALTHFFGWKRSDPLISLGIAAFVVPRIGILLREITDVLMETAPRGIDMEELQQAILEQPGAVAVHDLHVWAITPNQVCLSAHVVGADGIDRDELILQLNGMLRTRFALEHTTLQIEGSNRDAFRGQNSPGTCQSCGQSTTVPPPA